MEKKTIYVLASDFEGNSFMNMSVEDGCPLQRAFKRSSLHLGKDDFYNTSRYFKQPTVIKADKRVCRMFYSGEPIVDFSFEVDI